MFCDPQIKHLFGTGLYIKEMQIPAGSFVISHRHKYSHMSILATGRVSVITDIAVIPLTAPACIEIGAGTHHKIAAIEDSVWYCIHATAETDADCIDEALTDELDVEIVARLAKEET